MGSQVFEADEFSSQEFEWKEQAVKPGHARPVMIHRAVLGSLERFMAILTEHLSGKWPLWLSPRQVAVLAVSEKSFDYCEAEIYAPLKAKGFEVELDRTSSSLNKKIRNAQLTQFNYILVAGEEEVATKTISVRERGGKTLGAMPVTAFVDLMLSEYPDSVPLPV